jgi:hypothetical protein
VTVLDWSAALVGPRAYDVAFTSLVLAEPPIAVPRPLRPLVRAGGRWPSHRFVTQYRRRSGVTVDASTLCWYQGVVCARALVEVAFCVAAGEVESRRGHPLVSGVAFAGRLSRLTGTAVRPS